MKHRSNNKHSILYKLYKITIIIIAIILVLNYLVENSSVFYRKTIALPFSLHLNKQDLYMIKGEEFRIYVFYLNKRVSYSSTNFRVAGVNFNGRVFAHQTGKAFIIAKVKDKELRCRVHVIDINREKIELKVGDTYHMNIIGSNAFVRWKCNDTSVATINMFGKVKGKNKGRTIITAKIKGKVLKCTVKVN